MGDVSSVYWYDTMNTLEPLNPDWPSGLVDLHGNPGPRPWLAESPYPSTKQLVARHVSVDERNDLTISHRCLALTSCCVFGVQSPGLYGIE